MASPRNRQLHAPPVDHPVHAHELDAHDLDATPAVLAQYLTEQQLLPPPQPQGPVPAPLASQQLLHHYLQGNVRPPTPPPQAPLSRLVADYLKGAQSQQGAVPGTVPHVPPLLANLASPPAPLPLHRDANHAAQQQQQLLASAQLLSAVNPGLAAAAMAQALQLANAGSCAPPAPLPVATLPPAAAAIAQAALQLANAGSGAPSVPLAPLPVATLPPTAAAMAQVALTLANAGSGAPLAVPTMATLPPQGLAAVGAPSAQRLMLPHHPPAAPQLGAPAPHPPATSTAMAQYRQQLHSMRTLAVAKQPPAPISQEVLHQVSSGSSLANGSGHNGSRPGSAGDKPPAATGHRVGRARKHPWKAQVAPAAARAYHRGGGQAVAVSSVASSLLVPMSTMEKWGMDKLEAHVKQLQGGQQAIPQAVALLLAQRRRKEEKIQAKRLANRRSASTSRARKKALIEKLTEDNARLRRQALILSYLPDPVVAISTEGVITFCSMQVERVLKHDVTQLVGANIEDIIVPSSREAIRGLIRDLVITEQCAVSSSAENREGAGRGAVAPDGQEGAGLEDPLPPVGVTSRGSSEQGAGPPMREVKVDAGPAAVAAGEDVSDSSGDPPRKNRQGKASDVRTEMSSLTHSGGHGSNEEPGIPPAAAAKALASAPNDATVPAGTKKPLATESDSSSANQANANLNKNVEMCKLNKNKMSVGEVEFPHMDDVMGAFVTANNADAKLSSLMHHPKKKDDIMENRGGVDSSADAKRSSEKTHEQVASAIRWKHVLCPKKQRGEEQFASSSDSSSVSKPNNKKCGLSSEDSGYRQSPGESNEDQEDSLSSTAASSDQLSKKKQRRTRPLAPACNICLVRNDLSTIWCELTCSIRTRPKNNSLSDEINDCSNESADSLANSLEEEKELLLCFRPIREGGAAAEELRFCPKNVSDGTSNDGPTNASSDEPKVSASTSPSSDGPTNASSDDPKVSTSSPSSASGAEGNHAKMPKKPAGATPYLTETRVDTVSTPSARKNPPLKKRKVESQEGKHVTSNKKICWGNRNDIDETQVEKPDEMSAVESMIEFAKNVS